jgi:two-component system phosphate regulon sensor histidine kinase PhoR
VSHELKTPLALIRMFGETLRDNRVKSPEKAKEYHEIITRESTRLTHLINNILDFSRIEAGRKDYRKDPVDVGRVVRETYELYRHELDRAGFEHRCVIGDGLPEVLGDADAIGQVVLNLISNAIKYSAEEKHLVVEVGPETRRGKHGVLILVQDRGIGIRPEDRARLFDGFFRAADIQVRKRRGTGLGLALCKYIVEAHQGYIDVESRLVRGSTFRIFLPRQPTPTPAEESR